MSKYVMVSADFPDVNSTQRARIYKRLRKRGWKKFRNIGRDISTTWWGLTNNRISDDHIYKLAFNSFRKLSNPYTMPKIIIHIGPNKPKVYTNS